MWFVAFLTSCIITLTVLPNVPRFEAVNTYTTRMSSSQLLIVRKQYLRTNVWMFLSLEGTVQMMCPKNSSLELPQILVMIFSTQLVSLILHKQVSAAFAQRLRNLSNSS